MRPRPADLEGRIPRVPNRSRLRDAGRLQVVAAVEQQPQQFHPVVPAPASHRARSAVHHGSGDNPVIVDSSQQQVAATRPQPALLVAGQETLALGGPVGIRILGEQLAEPKADLRILRRFGHGSPEPGDRLLAPAEKRESAAELKGGPGRRRQRRGRGFE